MFLLAAALGASAVQAAPKSQSTLPREKLKVTPQLVATFRGPMPTGVTVSHRGRIFTNFPRWGDPVQFTVAEVRNGRAVPFPNMAWNRRDQSPLNRFVSVQSVVVDARDRLWALDTGSVKRQSNRRSKYFERADTAVVHMTKARTRRFLLLSNLTDSISTPS